MITISKAWAMPSAWTFTIKPIAALLERYVGDGAGWVDPFAGDNSPAEIRNDHNPERNAQYNLKFEVKEMTREQELQVSRIINDLIRDVGRMCDP